MENPRSEWRVDHFLAYSDHISSKKVLRQYVDQMIFALDKTWVCRNT